MRRRRARATATGVIAGIALLVPAVTGNSGGAHAHDHKSPVVTLRAEGHHQDGVPREIWWVDRRSKDECVAWNAVGPGDFPDAMRVDRGRKVRIRFHKQHKPRDASITMWKGLRVEERVVLGPPEKVDFELRRRARHGQTRAWDAVFQRPEVGEYYYEAFGEWRDRQDCGGNQGGYWRLSLQVGP